MMGAKQKAQCMGCAYASWRTTESGRLHPSGNGRCTWTIPRVELPKAYYWLGNSHPAGGYIERNDLRLTDCPQFTPKD